MSEDISLAGGCLCGAVRYSTKALPFASDYCHCRMCQRSTGAPVSVWMDFNTEEVVWQAKSDLQEYLSSADIRRGFCARCGSTLTYRSASHAGYLSLAVTSLDDPESVKPTYHIHTDSQLPWLELNDDCRRYAQSKT